MRTKLSANFLALAVMRGLDFLLPLITLPYLVATIGIEHFGLISFATSLALYFGALVQYGFSTTATRDISRRRDDRQELERIYSQTLWAALSLALVCAVVFSVITMSITRFRDEADLYGAVLMFVLLQSLFPVWFFQGMERMKFIAYFTLVARILYVGGLFLFVRATEDYVWVPLLNTAGAALTIAASLAVIHGQLGLKLQRPDLRSILSILRDGRHACISQLAPNLYNNSSTFLLGLVAAPFVVGVYSSATKLIDAANSCAYVLSNTFLPHIARAPQHHAKFAKLMFAVGIASTAVLVLAAEHITAVLFGRDSASIANYVRILSPGVLCVFVTLVYGANYLMLTGRERAHRNISLYTSVGFFVVALLIIPSIGALGAAITLVGARITMAIATYGLYSASKREDS